MKNRHLYILITFLLLFGIGTFVYKWLHIGVPLRPSETTNIWTIDARLNFVAQDGQPIKITFTLPDEAPNYNRLDENFVSRNYGVTVSDSGENRDSVWSIRRANGEQNLYYRLVIQRDSDKKPKLSIPARVPSFDISESEQIALESLRDQIHSQSADVETYMAEAIKLINDGNNKNATELLGRDWTTENKAQTIVKLVAQAKIPARVIQGMYLSQIGGATALSPWLVAYNGQDWLYFNPKTGTTGIPRNFFVWSYSDAPLLSLEQGATKPRVSFAADLTKERALELFISSRNNEAQSKLVDFSLFSLPVETQALYKIVLTIPIGAFIILLLRSFIGLATFGTFMPVLVALSFRDTGLIWGSFLFTFIVTLGLVVRFYFDRLHLLLVPRLSAILTIVIMLMAITSIISHKLGFTHALSLALFPIVILTMIIERMCIMWEERGAKETILTGAGSLVASIIAYFAMVNSYVSYLLFVFPELLIILLGLILFFSQYQGYRLSELKRFKVLAKE